MIILFRVVFIFLILLLSSCRTPPNPNPAGVQPPAASGNASLGTPAVESNLPTTGSNVSWYAAIKVSAEASNSAGQSTVLNGTRAKSVWATVVRALGGDNGEDKYSFVVQPTIDQVVLPPITALQIDHTKTGDFLNPGSESVTIATSDGVYSPWVPIEGGSQISLQTQSIGSSNPNFQLLSDAKNLSTTIGGSAGTLAVAGGPYAAAGEAALSAISGPIENMVNSSNTFKSSVTWSKSIFPFGGDPSGFVFSMNDVDGFPVATVKIDFVFRRTLREPVEDIGNSSYPNYSDGSITEPSFETLNNGSPTPENLQSVLAADTSLVHDLTQPPAAGQDLSSFWTACSASFPQFLQQNGLNKTDSIFFELKYLEPTLRQRPDLAAQFWIQCMPDSRKTAELMGIGDFPPTVLPLTAPNSVEVGYDIVHQGKSLVEQSSASEMLADSLIWQGNSDPIDTAAAIKKLEQIAAVNFYCNFSIPVVDPSVTRPGVTMFLRNPPAPDQVLEMDSEMYQPGTPAKLIILRAPTKAEFLACTESETANGGLLPIGPPPS